MKYYSILVIYLASVDYSPVYIVAVPHNIIFIYKIQIPITHLLIATSQLGTTKRTNLKFEIVIPLML